MKIVSNGFVGLWAVPHNHPVTCANDAPWVIAEMKLESNPIKIWIRGQNTMWFRADQCFINGLEECQNFLEWRSANTY